MAEGELLHLRKIKYLEMKILHISKNQKHRKGNSSCKTNYTARDENTLFKVKRHGRE